MHKFGRTDFKNKVKIYIPNMGIRLDARGAARDYGEGDFQEGKVPNSSLGNKLKTFSDGM